MSTARLLLLYLTYIVSCGRTYYTSQTLTRPVVIVMSCQRTGLASIWLLANLGPLPRMLPERGAGLGLGSNYGLRCPLARAGDPYGEVPAQAERRGTAAAAPSPQERAPCLPPHVCTRLERVEAAFRRQRGRIGGGIEPERQDTQVSAANR